MLKEQMIAEVKKLEEEGVLEIIAEADTHLTLWDGEKESILRFSKTLNKVSLLEEIMDTGSCEMDQKKLMSILSTLEDVLFTAIQKIVFIETEAQYEELMYQYFDNMDMMDFDEEVGKYLYYEDWVLINVKRIQESVREMTYSEASYRHELNIGLWTTLVHELRHCYQHTCLFEENVERIDIEDDAESYAIRVFEEIIRPLDYVIMN